MGTGTRRVYVAVRSAPTSGAPTHVAPTSSPSATTTSTCRPDAGSLSVTDRCVASGARRSPHTPIVTIEPRRLDPHDVGPGGRARADPGSAVGSKRARDDVGREPQRDARPVGGRSRRALPVRRALVRRLARAVGPGDEPLREVLREPARLVPPWAISPVPPSGGWAQSPTANTRGSSGLARSGPTTTPGRR